uniref:Tail assembly chaperone n=1 Tax=Siphoviridae sp. ctsxw88 TaxID=2825701 RepID=A0A8S5PH88_9CAUD|nr:MAG TPA: tail assembly chaperone [Siphoviridae sp. ctsxw88]
MAEQLQNINLNLNTRKKFMIDNNPNKIIELDVTDLGIAKRYADSINKMQELNETYKSIQATVDSMNEENKEETVTKINEFSEQMGKLERQMRDIIDFVFDSPISDIILENTSAFSPVQGKFIKYEQIFEVLSGLYTKHIKSDIDKISKRNVSKHTAKYVRK